MDKDVILVEEEQQENYEMWLEISGLLIVEELDKLIEICKKTKDNSTKALPLMVVLPDAKRVVGNLEVSLDALLSIYSISSEYTMVLVDGLSNESRVLFSPSNKLSGDALMNFITLV